MCVCFVSQCGSVGRSVGVRGCRTLRLGSENAGKICAFSAFQPGSAHVFEELLQQSEETPEFYLSLAPQFVGKTFGEAWRMLPQATLCGLGHADGTVELSPSDDTVIAPDDEVVLLAESSVVKISQPDEAVIPRPGSEAEYMRSLRKNSREKPLNLLFAGFGDETPIAVELVTEMAPLGSVVTILAENIPPDDMRSLRSTKNCKLKVMKGVPTSHRDLVAAKVQDMDTIIIMPKHTVDPAEADSSVLATVLQTDAICNETNVWGDQLGKVKGKGRMRGKGGKRLKAPHVVAMLNTDSARAVLERMTMTGASAGDYRPDIVMSDDIIGGALLQVAANPKLAGLFDALLETEGREVYMRDADFFGGEDTRGEDGEAVTWGTICERARMRNELALGILRASGEVSLSPAKAEEFVIEEGDRIIVLAEDFYAA